MTIHLPEDLERSIHAEVESGHFALPLTTQSPKRRPGRSDSTGSRVDRPERARSERGRVRFAHQPICEEIEEIIAGVPDEEFLKLPVDGAEQHDRCIYGTPKRSSSP